MKDIYRRFLLQEIMVQIFWRDIKGTMLIILKPTGGKNAGGNGRRLIGRTIPQRMHENTSIEGEQNDNTLCLIMNNVFLSKYIVLHSIAH